MRLLPMLTQSRDRENFTSSMPASLSWPFSQLKLTEIAMQALNCKALARGTHPRTTPQIGTEAY